jgi:hypothetical protein
MSPRPATLQDADRGPGARVAADIYGHLGPIAPGAYSVHRLSLQSNGSPQGPDEASSC